MSATGPPFPFQASADAASGSGANAALSGAPSAPRPRAPQETLSDRHATTPSSYTEPRKTAHSTDPLNKENDETYNNLSVGASVPTITCTTSRAYSDPLS